jgi:hypothetical protein
MTDIGDIGFQIRHLLIHWRQRLSLMAKKRRYAFVSIHLGTPQWSSLLVESRRKRRETPKVIHYIASIDLNPEVKTWIQQNARSNVSMMTLDAPGTVYVFFNDPDEALAFRMRWT